MARGNFTNLKNQRISHSHVKIWPLLSTFAAMTFFRQSQVRGGKQLQQRPEGPHERKIFITFPFADGGDEEACRRGRGPPLVKLLS